MATTSHPIDRHTHPSLLTIDASFMLALHEYTCTASPDLTHGSPAPAIVDIPCTKSMPGAAAADPLPSAAPAAGCSGMGNHLIWLGSMMPSWKLDTSAPCSTGTNFVWQTAGRTRYSQLHGTIAREQTAELASHVCHAEQMAYRQRCRADSHGDRREHGSVCLCNHLGDALSHYANTYCHK